MDHKPFVSHSSNIHEMTIGAVVMGAVLGVVFGASSLYLALKVGMTVSASIPVAVLSVTLFKALSNVFKFRRATILENNIVQTTGSAGESIAFGVAVTMPALLILGYDMEVSRIMTVAVLGGLLGVLLIIPMRYALIVKGHGELTFPEGTACAEVLIVGEKGGTSAKTVFTGFFLGLFYKFFNVGTKLWNDVPERLIGWFKGAAVSCEVSPELLGVGYIIGPRIACIMVAGGVLSAWVLIPAIKLFGDGLAAPLFPAIKPISQMSGHEIWRSYVLYIGAGAVTAGGLISLAQTLPTIVKSAVAGLGSLKRAGIAVGGKTRLDKDIGMKFVLGFVLLLVIAIWMVPSLKLNLLGAVLIVLFGFLFVTVSGRLVGTIGSSSNPISGMTVATLLLTSLIFVLMGWVGSDYRVTALSIAAVVCVAASTGGATAQSLKTGFLVGGTPRLQEISMLIGAGTSALVIGYTLNLLNDASTVYTTKNLPAVRIADVSGLTHTEVVRGPEGEHDKKPYRVLQLAEAQSVGPYAGIPIGKYLVDDNGLIKYLVDPGINGNLNKRDNGSSVQKYEAPKARLMSLIIDGILTQKLPWGLVLLGVAISIMMQLCGVSALPFAVGVYLPLSSSAPIFVGGVVRWLVERVNKVKPEESESSPGVLLSSGLIAGGAIAGILLALFTLKEGWGEALDLGRYIPLIAGSNITSVVMFGALCIFLYKTGVLKQKKR
ncbi:MAG: oligopeptide transporter, OPT family [Bdellovibrionales bacterium RIFOXYD1_FULL_53_11]|nr:MAG: oligopeptide transporter, OPT family [Bdellovibrionales bacterium RIFOXYD1_FULL_53_11]